MTMIAMPHRDEEGVVPSVMTDGGVVTKALWRCCAGVGNGPISDDAPMRRWLMMMMTYNDDDELN